MPCEVAATGLPVLSAKGHMQDFFTSVQARKRSHSRIRSLQFKRRNTEEKNGVEDIRGRNCVTFTGDYIY